MKDQDLIIATKSFFYKNVKGMVTLDGKFIHWGGISAHIEAWKPEIQKAAIYSLKS